MNWDHFSWKYPNDDFFLILKDFTTLMKVYYCSRDSVYFPVHADGAIYPYLRDFGYYCFHSCVVIISIATDFYMWLLIGMVDRLPGLSCDPWHQKHGLCICIMDWESIALLKLSLSYRDTTSYDQTLSSNVNHVLYHSWRCNKSLGMIRAPRSSSWHLWP